MGHVLDAAFWAYWNWVVLESKLQADGIHPLLVNLDHQFEFYESRGLHMRHAGQAVRNAMAASASTRLRRPQDEAAVQGEEESLRHPLDAVQSPPGTIGAAMTEALLKIRLRWRELWPEFSATPVEGVLVEAIEKRVKRLDWGSGDLLGQALSGEVETGLHEGAVGLLLTRIAFGGYLWRESERDVREILDLKPVEQVEFALGFARDQPSSRDQRGAELAVTAAKWAMEGLAFSLLDGLKEPLLLAAIDVAETVQRESGWDVDVPPRSRDEAFLYGYALREAEAEVE